MCEFEIDPRPETVVPELKNANPSHDSQRLRWILGLLCAMCLTAYGCFGRSSDSEQQDGTTSGSSGESEAMLVQVKTALASAENLEAEAAVEQWTKIRSERPDDPSVALNLALSAVLRVDELTATATDSVKSAEERKAARQKVNAALSKARSAIADYETNSGDEITSIWMASRLGAHEATLLGKSIGKSLRNDLFDELASVAAKPIAEEPKAVMLGGPIVELLEKMTDPVDGLPERLRSKAAATLIRLSDAHPENLFLAAKALSLAIENRSPRTSELVGRNWRLAKAVEPTLAAYTRPIGVTPEELTQRITSAVDNDDWSKAQQSFILWSNILNPLEIVRADRRKASPHPLDRLNFETVRQLSASLAKENPIRASAEGLPAFDDLPTEVSAKLLLALDADLDLQMDLITVGEENEVQFLQRDQQGNWRSQATLPFDDPVEGLVAADLFMVDSSDSDRIKATSRSDDPSKNFAAKARHNSLPSVMVYGSFGVRLLQVDTENRRGDGVLSVVSGETGLEDVTNATCVTVGDLEGDGDLDLVVATQERPLRIFVNRGNRTFFEADVGTVSVDEGDAVEALVIADLDRDIDLDVITLHRSGKIGQLENLLHLQFHLRYIEEIPALPVSSDDESLMLAVEDVDSNVGWDILAACEKQSLIAFANSSDIGVWAIDRVETGRGFGTRPVLADLDNDSFFEWVGSGFAARVGPWGISVIESELGIQEASSELQAIDLGDDGALDLVAVEGSTVTTKINPDRNEAHQMTVRFKGIADNAAASGRVNHYAIGSVLELRFGPHFRTRIVRKPSTHFGLGGFAKVDSIRVIMPNGLTQSVREPPVDSLVEEEQTLKGSCPYLYAWNGDKFEFVTDCLWAAPLGLQVAAGVVQKDRPWEYLKIDGRFVRPNADGLYELRMTEELWEVAYVDHVELLAVDHPADVEVFTNEKVGPPAIAQPTIFAFDDETKIQPTQSFDRKGREITKLLRPDDENYVKGFDRRLRQGLCEPHWIDVDFGEKATSKLAATQGENSSNDARVYLVLRGWILPTDTSLNIQIDQNPELPPIEFPSVWVPDASEDEGWKRVIEYMGFPGGKTKTIVVDVTEQILAEDPRLRVRTSAQIYWDSASLVVQSDVPTVVSQVSPLVDASVGFHGFSNKIKESVHSPETYEYDAADSLPKWPPLRGRLTSEGECTELLSAWDDSMVVISGGDEIRMRFRPPENAPPEGWRRDFVLHCVGWDKDADLNTLTGQSIGPLPIKDMSDYPPNAASQPRFDSVRDLNESDRRRRQSFRAFWRGDGGRAYKPFLAPIAQN